MSKCLLNRCLSVFLSLWVGVFSGNLLAEEQPKNLILIMDASGSLMGQVKGRTKIKIVQDVFGDIIHSLSNDTNVALVAYGHRRERDCSDVEILAPLGPVDKYGLEDTINKLEPKGRTPITRSLKQAFKIARTTKDPSTIILFSDGLETCGGDPCRAVANAKSSGLDFRMHVVTFDVGEQNVLQLECAAQSGGGLYVSAKDRAELMAGLGRAVANPVEVKGGKLSIKAVANGKPVDMLITVRESVTEEVITTGRTYAGRKINPRQFQLPPGNYNVDVLGPSFKGDNERNFKEIEIIEGKKVERIIDFTPGKLKVKVSVGGLLTDASVTVSRSKDGSKVAGKRTLKTEDKNPAIFKLTPGRYDISVVPKQSSGGEAMDFKDVELKSGQTLENLAAYDISQLRIKALINGDLGDTTVTVTRTSDGAAVVSRRTYTSEKHNPAVFNLVAGKYDVSVLPAKFKGGKKIEYKDIDLLPNKFVETKVEYWTGRISVGVTRNGEPSNASIAIFEAGTNKLAVSGRVDADPEDNPRIFEITEGDYDILITSNEIKGRTKRRIKNVVVGLKQKVERSYDYRSGTLELKVVRNDLPIDASISVTNIISDESVLSARSDANVSKYHLMPGRYRILSQAMKLEGRPRSEVEVVIEAGQVTEKTIYFGG